MPTYVVLYRLTPAGHKNVKNTIRRADEIRELTETAGFKLIAHYWTQGQYDLVTIVEAPSEEAMVAGLFNIAESGNVTSETMRAFSDDEVQRIIGPS